MNRFERTRMTTLHDKLNHAIDTLPAQSVMLSTILEIMGNDGALVLVVFLTLPFMVPVSLPGVSTVFGTVILLIGLCIMRDRQLWLPQRLMNRYVNADSLREALRKGIVWLNRLGKISRPRIPWLSQGQSMTRINGFMLMAGAVLLMAPFGFVPLSNTLPGLAVLFLAIGMLQKDGYCIMLGYLFNVVTIFYFTTLVGVGVIAAQMGIEKLVQWLL
jgi:hypothetical protein